MLSKAKIKQIRSLQNPKGRKSLNVFIIEGKRIVQEACNSGTEIQTLYFTEQFMKQNHDLITFYKNKSITETCISEHTMDTISCTETPPGILGICSLPQEPNAKELSEQNALYLDRVTDPGNMGTLLRTAAWFGLKHIILSDKCADVFNPKVVRGGMGAHFYIHFYTDLKLQQFFESHHILAADQHGQNVDHAEINRPFVLVMGSEATGISDHNRKWIHSILAIPKKGHGESLNVAVAGGILMEKLLADK